MEKVGLATAAALNWCFAQVSLRRNRPLRGLSCQGNF